MRDRRHWGAFADQLSQALDAPVLALDLPGNGTLQAQRSPERVEAMAAYCRQALRAQGLAPPYRVLAMSLGAMVAVAWAARWPQELECGVLVNTSLRPFSPFHRRLRPGAWLPMLRLLLARPDAREVEQTILRLTSRHPERHRAVVEDWIAWRRESPVSAANAARQLLAAARYRAPAAAPAVPLLLLGGAGDTLVDPRCSQAVAAAWGCELAVHPDAGHDLPLDDGAWVAQQLRAWLVRGAAAALG